MPFDPCSFEDGKQPVLLLTFLNTGETLRICQDCVVPYMTDALSKMTETPIEALIAATTQEVPELAEDSPEGNTDEPEESSPPRPNARGKRSPDPLPETSSAQHTDTDDAGTATADEDSTSSLTS